MLKHALTHWAGIEPWRAANKWKAPHRLWSLVRPSRSYVSRRSSGLHRLSTSRLSGLCGHTSCICERDLCGGCSDCSRWSHCLSLHPDQHLRFCSPALVCQEVTNLAFYQQTHSRGPRLEL